MVPPWPMRLPGVWRLRGRYDGQMDMPHLLFCHRYIAAIYGRLTR